MATDRSLYLRHGRRLASCLYIIQMEISIAQLDELTCLIEDSVEYFCDSQQVSGELAWSIIQCLSIAKQEELNGNLTLAQ